MHTLNPNAKVKEVEQNRLKVRFDDIVRPDHYGVAWFYFPGIGEIDTCDYNVVVRIERR